MGYSLSKHESHELHSLGFFKCVAEILLENSMDSVLYINIYPQRYNQAVKVESNSVITSGKGLSILCRHEPVSL
jgi:hypothetical protein